MKNLYTLKDYISMNGVEEVAKKFDVSVHTVKSWKYGNRRPCRHQAIQIISKSNLNWDSIYGPIGDSLWNRDLK